MGFYSVTPLTPGGWIDLLDEAELPHHLRRLPVTIAVNESSREVEARCLPMLAALAYLLKHRDGAAESSSVKAWRLAAKLVERMAGNGGEPPDLSRFTGAFPSLAHAAAFDMTSEEPEPTSARDAVDQFVGASLRALATAVREPKTLSAPESLAEEIDLSVLQPALRVVAPDMGAVAPVVTLRDQLASLVLRLEMPAEPLGAWTLRIESPDARTLATAAGMFAPLGRAHDGAAELTVDEVTELRRAASALQYSGARVELPAELMEQRDFDIDEAELAFRGGTLSLGGAVEYDLRAALGGREISEEEFRALAAASQPLVRLGGEWRLLDDRALRRARQLAQLALHGASVPTLTALGATLAGAAEVRGFAVGVDESDTELAALAARIRDEAMREPQAPAHEFHGELRPYQQVGLGWLNRMRGLGLGALLADDMGLGKTVQLIAHLLDRSDGVDAPALIVCPASVLGNWQRELRRFAPSLAVTIHHGPERTREIADLQGCDVVLTSYSLLPRDRRLLCDAEWRAVVLDEAQQVKNPLTRGAQAARALRAHHRIALTGTPIENRLDELWSIMHFLNPGLLDTRTAFRRAYGTPIERRGEEAASVRLRRITSPFILRRHKSDPGVLPDLPPRQESSEYCTLTLEQAALYQATIDAMLGELRGTAGIERRGHVLALLTRLKQVCNHPVQALSRSGALAGRSGKLDRLTEMLAEALDEGDSALVFTQYAVMGRLLSDHLVRELGVDRLYLDGSTPIPERERMVQRFQAAGDDPRVFVMSLKAGGLGLNLTNASHVFHFDRWWNPAVEDQASDRAHRIGQTRVVQVHKMICAGTVEERIDELIESKRGLASSIVDRGVETALSELSDQELAELVELRDVG
jgi:superfamily II DNA or RNA helicase